MQKKSHGTGFHYEDKEQPVISRQQRRAGQSFNVGGENDSPLFRRQQRREDADLVKLYPVAYLSGVERCSMWHDHLAAELRSRRGRRPAYTCRLNSGNAWRRMYRDALVHP